MLCQVSQSLADLRNQHVLTVSKHGPGPGSGSEISLAYIVRSVVQQSCQISASVLPDSQWKAVALTVPVRSSGRISLGSK